MRERLIDKIRKDELNICDYVQDLNKIIFDNNTRFIFSEAFKQSVYSDCAIELHEFYNRTFADIEYSNNFVMDYIEFILNLYVEISEYNKDYYRNEFDQLIAFIKRGLNKLGCSTREDKDGYISVYYENIEIETIAIQLAETKQSKIYKYLSLRKGDVVNKLTCIKDLMTDVESITNSSNNKSIKKIKQLYQCIRHTEDDKTKQRKFPFMYNDDTKEEWLDKIFLSIVNLFGYNEIKEFAKEIKDNEQD